jgi:hypothetical protein
MIDIKLMEDDPTIFAKCPTCCKGGNGVKFGPIFLRAYTARKWQRGPVCDNCNTAMVFLYEVK